MLLHVSYLYRYSVHLFMQDMGRCILFSCTSLFDVDGCIPILNLSFVRFMMVSRASIQLDVSLLEMMSGRVFSNFPGHITEE